MTTTNSSSSPGRTFFRVDIAVLQSKSPTEIGVMTEARVVLTCWAFDGRDAIAQAEEAAREANTPIERVVSVRDLEFPEVAHIHTAPPSSLHLVDN